MSEKTAFTRRDFLKGTVAGAAGVALTSPSALYAGKPSAGQQRSRVVLIRDKDAMSEDGSSYNGPVIERMLDEAVCALLGINDAAACWKTLLKPEDTLGIKTNVWRHLPTPRELEQALKTRAMAAGIPESRISIRDRGLLNDPIFTKATALINTRPLRTHHWSGIGGCLKNYITFHPRPWDWHGDSCADLAGLWKLPVCKDRTRLNILVVMRPQFHNVGPHHFDPKLVWPYRGLLVSTDPVSLDSIGVHLLEKMREQHFERPPRGGTSTKHVPYAETRHGIGVADMSRIDLIKLGWDEEILI